VPENKSLNILINTKYEGKGLTDLRKDFNDNKKTLDELRRTNQQTSDTYKNLVREQGQLSDSIRGLTREYKGLDAVQKKSSAQWLEFGENLTIVSAGIMKVAGVVGGFISKSVSMGAELSVLRGIFKGSSKDIEDFRKAVGGTETETALIKMSNRASDLGFTLSEQKALFALAEDAADAYGGSVESNVDTIVNALAKNGKGLEQLGISSKEFKNRMTEVENSYKALGKEMTAQEILQAQFKIALDLSGNSLDSWKGKTMDAKDMIDSLGVAVDETLTAFGTGFVDAFDSSAEAMDGFGKAAEVLEGIMNSMGKRAGEVASDIANYFSEAAKYVDGLYGKYAPQDVKDARSQYEKDKERVANRLAYLQEQDEKKKRDNNSFRPSSRSSSKGGRDKTDKEIKDELKKVHEMMLGFILFDTAKNINALLPESMYKVNGSAVSSPGLGNEPMFTGKIAPIEQELSKNFITVNNAIIDATHSLSAFFGVLAGGDSSNDGFKDFMKSIVNTFITSIEAMILASAAAMSGKAITTFGLSLFTDAPLLAAAFASLELARGIIGGLAGGGQAVEGRPYIVGEQGREMFVPNTTGQVINTMDLKNMMSGSSSSPTNIYINSEVDFIRFHKVMNAQVRTRRQDKIL